MSTDASVAENEIVEDYDQEVDAVDSEPEPEPESKPKKSKEKAPKAAKPAKAPKAVPAKPAKPVPVKASQPAEDNPILTADHEDLTRVTEMMSLGSDITRVKLLAAVDGIRTVGDLSNLMNQSQPATSHHLALLRAARLIVRGREGKNNLYDLTKDGKKLLKIVSGLLASEGA